MSARYDRASSIPILPINGDKMSSFANIWRKPIFYSAGQEVLQRDGEIKFTMTCGGVSRCTVRVMEVPSRE